MFRILILIALINSAAFADENFHSKCGTFRNYRQKVALPKIQNGRPQMQKSYISSSGKFKIHYDISGKNAVDATDGNQNGIPDYIDSVSFYFDYVNHIYVDEIGYKYPDDLMGGASEEYDIYIMELGLDNPAYYGITDPSGTVPSEGRYTRYASFITIDNNFSPLDSNYDLNQKVQSYSTFGYDALKVTAAHEYFHAIHFYYGLSEFMYTFAEMVSSSMEIRIFPDLKDYYSYTRKLLLNPTMNYLGGNDPSHGYPYAVFGEYLFKKYGDRIMKRTWELVSKDLYHFDALDSSLKEAGSNLRDSWTEFTSWLYYTGKRADGEKYLSNASIFPELKFEKNVYSYPSISNSDKLLPLEFRPERIIFPGKAGLSDDTADVIITACTHETAGYPAPKNFKYSYIFTELDEGMKPLGNTPYSYEFYEVIGNNSIPVNAESNICYNLWLHPGVEIFFVEKAFPQPFDPVNDEALNIPAPSGAFSGEEAIISIYNTSFIKIADYKSKVVVLNKFPVFQLKDLPKDMNSGVYVFELNYKDDVRIGKLAIIRK